MAWNAQSLTKAQISADLIFIMVHQIGSFNIAFTIHSSYLTYNAVTARSPSIVKRVDKESLGWKAIFKNLSAGDPRKLFRYLASTIHFRTTKMYLEV